MYNNPIIINTRSNGLEQIKQSMSDWGNGARCEIAVVWESGSAHVFMAEQVDNQTIFIDPQTNKHYEESIFETVVPRTRYFRVDNLDFNDCVIDCCLNRKRGNV